MAQKRSEFSDSLARRICPSAVTTSAETKLSMLRPCLRVSQPIPPPRVSPPTPVWPIKPTGVASPCSCVAAIMSANSVPPPTRTRRASASTATEFIALKSIISPSSTTALPDTPCAPPRTAISSPLSTPTRTAAATSAELEQRAMTAGRRSIAAFHKVRASS